MHALRSFVAPAFKPAFVRTMASVPTIFDKILAKEIPSTKVYEDDLAYAFRDIAPVARSHVIVIPKNKDGLDSLSCAEERHKAILGHLMYVASVVAKMEGLSGYRIVMNNGPEGCQSVFHIHLHIIGGHQLTWPPGV